MQTPISDRALAALLEIAESRREQLAASCVLADAEDHVAQTRCAQIIDESSDLVRCFSRRAQDLAALAERDAPAPAIAAAAAALETARAALIRGHQRVVEEWATISHARLDRARDLFEQIARVCVVTSVLPDPTRRWQHLSGCHWVTQRRPFPVRVWQLSARWCSPRSVLVGQQPSSPR